MKMRIILAFLGSVSFWGAAHLEAAAAAACLELPHADNITRNLCDKQGKNYIIIEFFSPGCPACQRNVENYKRLEQATKDFAHSRLVSSADLPNTQSFIERHAISSEVAVDPARRAGQANRVRGVPTVIVIDRNNNIIYESLGVLSNETIDHIKSLIQLLDFLPPPLWERVGERGLWQNYPSI